MGSKGSYRLPKEVSAFSIQIIPHSQVNHLQGNAHRLNCDSETAASNPSLRQWSQTRQANERDIYIQ
jgi:hypothetical protein